MREELAPFNDVPIIFTSVLHKQRIHKALETALEVFQNRKKRIATSELNKVMLPLIEYYPPPSLKGKTVKIKYITQLPEEILILLFSVIFHNTYGGPIQEISGK